jgi:hypothetical protein
MKTPVVLIVAAIAGALLVAGAGASAQTVLLLGGSPASHSSGLSDEASGARTESPEPSERAEPSESPEPSEAPEPADTETDEDADDNDAAEQEQHDSGSGEHDSGGDD